MENKEYQNSENCKFLLGKGREVAKDTRLYETSRYRALVSQENPTEEFYLLLCGVERCLPGYLFRTEGRKGFHLHVITGGKGVLSVEGRETVLHEGQMFMTKPQENTWYRADEKEPWEYCWMTFGGTQAEEYAAMAGFQKGVNYLDCNVDYHRFPPLVRKILDRPGMNTANGFYHTSALLEYLANAIESYTLQNQVGKHVRTDYADTYVEYAVNYIEANFSTAKVSDVARFIGIHRSYLTSIFQKKMGVSPQEYLMKAKMKAAERLLLNSLAPVQEVSQMVGYDNPLTFSKAFKNYYGMSPRAFREAKRTE